jgi:glycosyltransferase involved in cell wall biosynthesis
MALRVAVLWSRLSGYFSACLKHLRMYHEAELFVVHWPVHTHFPFDDSDFDWIAYKYPRSNFSSARSLARALDCFHPHIVLVSGWIDRTYLQAALRAKQQGALVVGCVDNQWRGTLRQQIAIRVAPVLLRTIFSVIWTPGERSAQFAKRMGFTGSRLWRGLYSGDTALFSQVCKDRFHNYQETHSWNRVFLFIGQYIERKGLLDLLAAYRRYREQYSSPWELWCIGHGPLKARLAAESGLLDLGFIQPGELARVFAASGCVVLPSRCDEWPVVLHESAASGLPIICTDECGSSVELLRDGYNGFLVQPRDVDGLVQAMGSISNMDTGELCNYGLHSVELANSYSTEQWASYLIMKYSQLRP